MKPKEQVKYVGNTLIRRWCLITMSVQEEKQHREEPEWRTEIFSKIS